MKIARIEEIKESRDNAQRVVVLTYHNVSKNKKGNWIGTPVTVERSVNDLILVDDALNESMLNPAIQKNEVKEDIEETTRTDKAIAEENPNLEIADNVKGNEENDEGITTENPEAESTNDDEENYEHIEAKDEIRQDIRRSKRKRNQRFNIHPDEIGECEDEKDEDYK